MQRFVKLNNTKNTFAVLSKGPCEYMIYNNKEIALTLFRSVGKLGKADLLIRPGRSSGYRLDAPSSQLLKELTFEYSLFIGESENIGQLFREANMLNVPVPSRQLNIFKREKHEERPWENSILELPENVELTAFKRAENKDGYVLRILNPGKEELHNVNIKVNFGEGKAYLSSLREKAGDILAMDNGIITIPYINKESFVTIIIK